MTGDGQEKTSLLLTSGQHVAAAARCASKAVWPLQHAQALSAKHACVLS